MGRLRSPRTREVSISMIYGDTIISISHVLPHAEVLAMGDHVQE